MQASEQLKQTLQSLQAAIDAKRLEIKGLQDKVQELNQTKSVTEQEVRNSTRSLEELEQQAKALENNIQSAINAEKLM